LLFIGAGIVQMGNTWHRCRDAVPVQVTAMSQKPAENGA